MTEFIRKIIAHIAVVLTFLGIMTVTPYDRPVDPHNGGDPFIAEANGEYYYTFTTGGGIDIRQIKSPESAKVIREKTVIWAGEHGIDYDIWAPEIHEIGGRWCVLFDFFGCEKEKMGYVPFISSKPGDMNVTRCPDLFNFPYGYKHGGVVEITEEEYERLKNAKF